MRVPRASDVSVLRAPWLLLSALGTLEIETTRSLNSTIFNRTITSNVRQVKEKTEQPFYGILIFAKCQFLP